MKGKVGHTFFFFWKLQHLLHFLELKMASVASVLPWPSAELRRGGLQQLKASTNASRRAPWHSKEARDLLVPNAGPLSSLCCHEQH